MAETSDTLQRMNRQCLSYARGVMDIAAQQMAWAGGLAETCIRGVAAMGQARTPDEWLHREVELFRGQAERTLEAAARIGGIMQGMVADAAGPAGGQPGADARPAKPA